MSKLRDILRLILTTVLSDRQIGEAVAVSKNTVRRYRHLAQERELRWEDIKANLPAELESLLNKRERRLSQKRLPDFTDIHLQLARPGVTLQLLWEEYRLASADDALSYSQFTHHYRQYTRRIKLSMRQTHVPGHKAFVDFSGKRPHYVRQDTGELVAVELFIGVLGYSVYTFALATESQKIQDWIQANVLMLDYFGGVPEIIVPDNLKAAVVKPGANRRINRAYLEFADYYGTVIMPARSRHPKDKSKAEVSVQIAQRWILARLRNMQFFSLGGLNQEIRRLCDELNLRPFKKMPGCRFERLEQEEQQHLKPLPAAKFEWATWSARQAVGPDYHVSVDGAWYSVPFHLVGESVEARATLQSVEIFHCGVRVASHVRVEVGKNSTDPAHQPPQHRAYAEHTPEKLMDWARGIGPGTLAVVKQQFNRSVPALGLPACDSLKKLGRQYGSDRLEQACIRALQIQSPTVKSVRSLLGTRRYLDTHPDETRQVSLPLHHNVRGPGYYAGKEDPSC
ncbi:MULTISPECIES: IS21 family transposase [Comamonas]|uniref:IS21 family transposase n=1 Tax=Comamonas TaxID=283 RepID=UPI0015FCAC01|nr:MULTISPECIES: IS21 family transposase [Comamonas]UUC96592.1 IS21 family transposase [Comamonas sp. C11]